MTKRTQRTTALSIVAGLLLGAIALAATPSVATADGATCGSKENPCPLQKWMRTNIGTPMSGNDLAAVATGLEKASALSPDPAWSEWATISKEGAAAAKKGDVAATKASCKSCHDKFKDKYKEKFRTRAVP